MDIEFCFQNSQNNFFHSNSLSASSLESSQHFGLGHFENACSATDQSYHDFDCTESRVLTENLTENEDLIFFNDISPTEVDKPMDTLTTHSNFYATEQASLKKKTEIRRLWEFLLGKKQFKN